MMLRVSTAGLQDDLRDTMRAYTEEKLQLSAHLSTLRLDLSQLHRDDRTVSSSDQSCAASHVSFPASDVEPELKRLVEEDDEDDAKTARSMATSTHATTTGTALAPSMQLPALKGLNPYKSATGCNTNKSLRFSNSTMSRNDIRASLDKDAPDGGSKRSFIKDDGWDGGQALETKEQQKFKELQRNQDMLRNIGRANLREKRMSLIRLPTITSAKKRRQTTWDSGKNVSRPAGKSTVFETYPYLEDSVMIKKKNFKIPAIRDPKRSEIQLDPDMPRQPDHQKKKKVQFTRPGEANTSMMTMTTNPNLTAASSGILNTTSMTSATVSVSGTEDRHNESIMGGESLNTTLADTTMGDTSFQHINFDPEQMKALAQIGLSNKSTTTGGNSGASTDRSAPDDDKTPRKFSEELANMKPTDLPPLKVKTLRRKNVLLHDLNTPGLTTGHGKGNWDKASDMSVLTKISRLSLETEEWKNSYMSAPDPDQRKKTLSDIMFAVRTRMRENEASLRFGETPRPSDEGYGFLLADQFQQRSPRRSNKSPRKVVKGQSVRGAASLQLPKARPSVGDQSGKTAAQLQGYLRRVYRHRRGPAPAGDTSNRSNKGGQAGTAAATATAVGEDKKEHRGGGAGSGALRQPCSQEAAKLDRRRGIGAMAVAQQA